MQCLGPIPIRGHVLVTGCAGVLPCLQRFICHPCLAMGACLTLDCGSKDEGSSDVRTCREVVVEAMRNLMRRLDQRDLRLKDIVKEAMAISDFKSRRSELMSCLGCLRMHLRTTWWSMPI
jgi:hypothetical protein